MTRQIKRILRNEYLGHILYKHLATLKKNDKNKEVLNRIGEEEMIHYIELSNLTNTQITVNRSKIKFYKLLITIFSKLLGVTFILKFFERAERKSNKVDILINEYPEVVEYIAEEEKHENMLLSLIDEERLNYVGSIVLGLNDALVELTGALAGFTLSLQDSRTIAIIGLITGISAAFSMAASEYLSTREDENPEVNPIRASIYTGISYIITVFVLVTPYLLGFHYLTSLGITISLSIIIIAAFNYYISVAKDSSFRRRFIEMALISLGVATISFLIGFLVDTFIGI